jgi:hypothetical protein
VYAIGGQGNQGKAVHPSIERLDGERFVLLPQQMKAERKYVSASGFAGDQDLGFAARAACSCWPKTIVSSGMNDIEENMSCRSFVCDRWHDAHAHPHEDRGGV